MTRYILFVCMFFSTLVAIDLNGRKFCIDPGHGDYYNSEKPFETLMNMEVALHFKEFLEQNGSGAVVLTRNGNFGSDTNPSLSERVRIANEAGVDWFHSVHHNTYDGTVNYTLMLYREDNGYPAWQQAKDAGDILAQRIYQALRTSNGYNRGDYSFLGFHLGVLSGLEMPGVLSEGSFWDYSSEIPRLQNCHYLRLEAWAIVQAYLEYFKCDRWTTGCIAGIVRDGSGNRLRSGKIWIEGTNYFYQLDDIGNGFFAFINVPAGRYTIYYRSAGFIISSSTINVSANTITFADKTLSTDNCPNIQYTNPKDAAEIRPDAPLQIRFSRTMDKNSTQAAFKVDGKTPQGTFNWSDDYTMVFYPTGSWDRGTIHILTVGKESKGSNSASFDGDYDGVGGETEDDYKLVFKIGYQKSLENIQILDDFEDNSGNWWDPEQSGSTTWTYPERTYRETSNDFVFSGNNSMKLRYQFTNLKEGICRIYRQNNLGPWANEDTKEIGLWVYGDNSGNRLEFWFYTPSNQMVVAYDYMYFWGWKYVSVALKDVPGTDKKFHSLVVRKMVDKNYVGSIYFDKLIICDHQETGFNNKKIAKKIPFSFSAKAFPNPFRQIFNLEYSIEGRGGLMLAELYDMTGRKIKTLINQNHGIGTFRKSIDTEKIGSGIYILRIKTEDKTQLIRLVKIQ
ncbi:MAG: N-acetylmuramoyl-L-alanine amidase [Candidatus Coatesbacteria bacterium]|nr:N-acetylmuramoyl-L-alanine amidase [Candidatus Coatesbacteria bacterium]